MGSNRLFWGPVQSLNREVKLITGTFFPQGAGAIVNASNLGQGWTVARTGVGIYTITFADVFNSVVSKILGVQFAGLTATQIQWGAIDVAVAKTAVINAYVTTTGVAGEIVANAANSVSFGMLMLNQSFQ
jgi:hypothetical protein